MKQLEIKNRLEYLRQELRGERISTGELIELESLKDHIEDGDVDLLEAAGVPEFEGNTIVNKEPSCEYCNSPFCNAHCD